LPELPLTGRCACGRLRYRSDEAPLAGLYCQCRDCQYDSGTGHSCHVMLAGTAFALSGPVKLYESMADSGESVVRGFCPECGSSMIYRSDTFPGVTFVTAGSLDDPAWFMPTMIVYTSSAQPWDRLDAALARFDRMPPQRPRR
jgi:hypothetical protein